MRRLKEMLTGRRLLRVGSPILILILWEGVVRSGSVASFVLPAPSVVFQTLLRLLVSGELLPHIYMSLFRALSGFILGSVLGILLGLMMGWSKFVEDVADVPFQVLRAVPKTALVPLFIVWFGIGEFPKVLLILLTPFVMCTINTMVGVRSVDITMVRAARSLGAHDRQILREVVIPSASPMIFAALRLSAVVSLVLLLIAEMVAAEKGLGVYIMETQRLFYIDKTFAGIVTITIFGYSVDWIIRKIETRALQWRKSAIVAGGRST